jgi:hypothetical protein
MAKLQESREQEWQFAASGLDAVRDRSLSRGHGLAKLGADIVEGYVVVGSDA